MVPDTYIIIVGLIILIGLNALIYWEELKQRAPRRIKQEGSSHAHEMRRLAREKTAGKDITIAECVICKDKFRIPDEA